MKRLKKHSERSTHSVVLDSTIFFLRFAGFWVYYGKSASPWEIIYKIYNKIILIVICIFAVTVFADLCSNYDDLVILTDDGCVFAGLFMTVFKTFNFHVKSEQIKAVIETVHKPIVALDRSSDLKVRVIVGECSFYEKILLYVFRTNGTFLWIALIFLVPVEKGELPIRAKFPFDVAKSPLYEVAFCLQAYGLMAILISAIGIDSIVLGLYQWTNMQLVILNANYENCRRSKCQRAALLKKHLSITGTNDENSEISCFIPFDDEEASVNDNDSFLRRFKTCIKHHQRLIGNVDELNELFEISTFVQLFASFCMICFTGFQAVLGSRNLSSSLKFGVFLGAAFFQLFIWCWTGNALVHQNASLATSQWLSGWEDHISTDVMTLMTISLMQTTRPLRIKAGKLFVMSMEMFLMVLRSCYSFFALLAQVTKTDG